MSLVDHRLEERDGTMAVADVEEERVEYRVLLDVDVAACWMKL